MKIKTCSIVLFSLALCTSAKTPPPSEPHPVYGPLIKVSPQLEPRYRNGPRKGLDSVRRWNEIALIANGVDHTPVAVGENRVFGEQVGPCRTAYALAIVHIAIFDTLNAVFGKYESYTGVQTALNPISMQAAISEAAHDTLVVLYPSQTPEFDAWLNEDLAEVKNKYQKANGVALGRKVATAILLLRANDGAHHTEPRLGFDWTVSNLAGRWRQDPVTLGPLALGGHWNAVTPFIMQSSNQFRVLPPPLMTTTNYTAAFDEAKRLGGDGVITPTQRTPEQTAIGLFWAYDGTPRLGTPPRFYNQIAVQIAGQMKSDEMELARLLALVNVTLADTGIAIWDSKYYYDFWRPVTAIRESDPGTGPTGSGDGNPATIGDPNFSPLGAPASNLSGPNFTPPFPAYPSGHAGFGGAFFEILRRFYQTDRIAFTVVSDELNGETLGNDGHVRPRLPRSFASLSQAEEENGQSRIYLGIHWRFDKTEGIAQGRRVGDYVFDHTFLPLRKNGR